MFKDIISQITSRLVKRLWNARPEPLVDCDNENDENVALFEENRVKIMSKDQFE